MGEKSVGRHRGSVAARWGWTAGSEAEHGGAVRVHQCPVSVSGVVSRDARAAAGREPAGNTSHPRRRACSRGAMGADPPRRRGGAQRRERGH